MALNTKSMKKKEVKVEQVLKPEFEICKDEYGRLYLKDNKPVKK